MILYQFLKENQSVITSLQVQNVLPVSINDYIEIYNDVIKELETGKSKTESYWNVAEKRNINVRTVITVVVKMQSEI